VRRVVEMHGGTVEAHSDGPGLGSEFIVRLPLSEISAEGLTAGIDEPASATARKFRVLVVDDNVDSADSIATLLRLYGHDVVTAYDGFSAIDLAEARRPDFVLLDI